MFSIKQDKPLKDCGNCLKKTLDNGCGNCVFCGRPVSF